MNNHSGVCEVFESRGRIALEIFLREGFVECRVQDLECHAEQVSKRRHHTNPFDSNARISFGGTT